MASNFYLRVLKVNRFKLHLVDPFFFKAGLSLGFDEVKRQFFYFFDQYLIYVSEVLPVLRDFSGRWQIGKC